MLSDVHRCISKNGSNFPISKITSSFPSARAVRKCHKSGIKGRKGTSYDRQAPPVSHDMMIFGKDWRPRFNSEVLLLDQNSSVDPLFYETDVPLIKVAILARLHARGPWLACNLTKSAIRLFGHCVLSPLSPTPRGQASPSHRPQNACSASPPPPPE